MQQPPLTMKKSGYLKFSLLVLILFASCDWRVVRDPNVLVGTFPSDPPTLNPILDSDYNAYLVNKYVYESLLDRDSDTFALKPGLAERWEISADHLSYTFWLRKGVKWHDGEPFTIDDVIYTFERVLDPKVDAAQIRGYFHDVKRVERAGDDAVRFIFSRPYFRAIDNIGNVRIIPKHIFDDGGDFNSNSAGRAPVGTGPYRFSEWKTGRFIRLARSDLYWGKRPEIEGIEYRIIPDQTSAFLLMKKGAIDLRTLTPIQWIRQTAGGRFDEGFARYRYYLPNASFIGWNMRKPFFSDRRARIAMTMLIDREAILKEILFGEGEVVTSDFYRFGVNYDPAIKPYPYDPVEARRLLDEAGWVDHNGDGLRDKDGVPFRFSLLMPAGDPFGKSIGLFLKEELSKAGIVMEIRQLEWASMLGMISKRDFDATVLGRAGPVNEDPYQVWHSSQSKDGSNFVGFESEKADRLISGARIEFDPAKRAELYRELQLLIHEEEPYSFLFTRPTLVAVAKRFIDVKEHKLGLDPLEWNVGPWPMLIEW